MDNNRKRVLAEVLSIDAWHKPFRTDGLTSSVYVELSFQEGRIGGNDPEMPFTFRIKLKRALLTIHLERPLLIDRSTVARNIPKEPIVVVGTLSEKQSSSSSAKANISASLAAPKVSASVAASSDLGSSAEQKMTYQQHKPRILVSAKPRGLNEYAWELTPTFEGALDGQPWDPLAEPRLSVRHPSETLRLPPAIRVVLTCALEDVAIDELTPKKDGVLDIVRQVVTNEVSYAAAVQYLKTVLAEADLEVGTLDNRFSELLIAEVMSAENP